MQSLTHVNEAPRVLKNSVSFCFQAWLCVFIACVAIGPILWVFHNTSYYYKVSEEGPGGLAKLSNCVWYCYGSVLSQGGTMLPDADSGRVLVGNTHPVKIYLNKKLVPKQTTIQAFKIDA